MQKRVLTLLAAMVVSAAGGDSAFSADILSPPRSAALPLVYDWSGFYLGGHIGYAWDQRDADVFGPAGNFLVSGSTNGSSAIGGGQIGYNFAFGPRWIFGLEADYSGGALGGTAIGDPTLGQRENKIDSFGTARARIGYAWGRFMAYGTGGFAWAHENMTRTQQSGTVNAAIPGIIEEATAFAPGWAAGLGFEWGVSPGWTLRAEYMHLDLAAQNFTFPQAGQSIEASARINAFRLGVNYIFNVGGPRTY